MPTHSNKPQLKSSRTKSAAGIVSTALTRTKWQSIKVIWKMLFGWPKHALAQRLLLGFIALIILITAGMYGIAQWYIASQSDQPEQLGVSFIPDYATYLGVDPQQTMDALLKIGVKHFRLVSYWSDVEPTPGNYDFSSLDWEFQKAEAAHAKITLTLGLRQPRWPECHAPNWVDTSKSESTWQPQLEQFMTKLVNRYHASPSLQDYQLENEYFLSGFGTCNNFDRNRLVSEFKLVKGLDPKHQIIVTRSNNDQGTPIGQPTPDEFGVSVYKRTWDANVTKRYLEYPYPAWLYAFLAGTQELINHKNMRITELQAEAWPPNYGQIPTTTLAEQNKSFDAARFKQRLTYAKNTGMHQVDLWGAEYWYYRLTVLHDPSLWNVAQQAFAAKN